MPARVDTLSPAHPQTQKSGPQVHGSRDVLAAAPMGQVVADSTKALTAATHPQPGELSTAHEVPHCLAVGVSLDLSQPPFCPWPLHTGHQAGTSTGAPDIWGVGGELDAGGVKNVLSAPR